MLRFLFTFLLLNSIYLGFSFSVVAEENIPGDVRYMLEDMYGADKNKWPAPRYKEDLNKDGFSDWIAIKKECSLKKDCPADIFICIPDKKGACSEYCYIEVKNLTHIQDSLKNIKCESTC